MHHQRHMYRADSKNDTNRDVEAKKWSRSETLLYNACLSVPEYTLIATVSNSNGRAGLDILGLKLHPNTFLKVCRTMLSSHEINVQSAPQNSSASGMSHTHSASVSVITLSRLMESRCLQDPAPD